MNKKRDCKIIISKNGPYVISGDLPLCRESIIPDDVGNSVKWKRGKKYKTEEKYNLCRCGHSQNKPFCDGHHIKINFNGNETAKGKKFLDTARKVFGPRLELIDNIELCSLARFCHNKEGDVWSLTEKSNNLKSKKEAIKQACNCPSGRLVMIDKKTGKVIEPRFKPELSLVEDIQEEVSGPIWVKGEVPIESYDGSKYEIRNRVTLCRCGHSNNKPFCDGSHIDAKFRDDK